MRTHPASYQGNRIFLVTSEYDGLHPHSGGLGKLAKRMAGWSRDNGLRSVVIVPYSRDLANVQWDKTESTGLYPWAYGRFDGVPVFALRTDAPFKERHLSGSEAIKGLMGFAAGLEDLFQIPKPYSNLTATLVHCLDYSMGVVVPSIERILGKRTIFTPVDPIRFDQEFPAEALGGSQLSRYLGDLREGHSGPTISGLMLGAKNADAVTLWSERFLGELRGDHRFNRFLDTISTTREVLPGNWHPNSGMPIPDETLSGMADVYLRTLFGVGLRTSIHFLSRPNMKIDRTVFLVMDPSNRTKPSRTIPILAAVKRAGLDELANDVVVVAGGQPGVFNDYSQNSGGLMALLDQVLDAPDFRLDGRYVIVPDGGYFERGHAYTQSVGVEGLKSLTQDGTSTLGMNCVRQAPILFRQLPNHGKGWVVFSAADNEFNAADFMKAGRRHLWEIEQGFVLTGPPRDFELSASNDDLDGQLQSVKNLGWWVTDKNGRITVFAEKSPPNIIRHVLRQRNDGRIHKNTFVFAFTIPVAEKLRELYKKTPCAKDGRPFVTTYPIDISSHIICPTTLTREDWEKVFDSMQNLRSGKKLVEGAGEDTLTSTGLSIRSIATGMLKFEYPDYAILFDHKEDWMTLWHFGQEILSVSKGIAGASMGENCSWDDFGSQSAIVEMWERNRSTDPIKREVARVRSKIPLDRNIADVKGIEHVTFVDPTTKQPLNLPPGETPEDVIIVRAEFSGPVTIEAAKITIDGTKFGKDVNHIPGNSLFVGGEIDQLVEAAGQLPQTANLPYVAINCFTAGGMLRLYRGFFHTSLSLQRAEDADLATSGYGSQETPIALDPIYVNPKDALSNNADPWLLHHPAVALLDPAQSIMGQSFVVEDAAGVPKLLGMNFLQVRGGW